DGWSDSVDPLIGQSMGETAENLVDKYQLSREDLDQLALESHQKAFRAQSAGLFDDEIVHLSLPGGGKSGDILFQKDETIRPDCDLEKLGVLKTSFKKDGKITAGNSCGLSDGASAVILCERKTAKDLGIKPLFSLVSFAQAAAEPVLMGEGPGIVMPLALRKAGLTLSDMDLLEVNEAFSAQILVNERQMKWDRDRLNVHGGAIALGHPTGSSGARILITGYHALKARDKEFLLAGICGGGGVTTAMIIKRENDSV
ncbi:MAG: thiolase family protein, partial [Deltaproteobacteria bacterium]|nr:thiolase family protein [Deltaproteobacteria bacterium]